MAMGGQHALPLGESADQHEQARLRQVEVCEQRAYKAKREAGGDEDLRLSGVRPKRAACGVAGAVF